MSMNFNNDLYEKVDLTKGQRSIIADKKIFIKYIGDLSTTDSFHRAIVFWRSFLLREKLPASLDLDLKDISDDWETVKLPSELACAIGRLLETEYSIDRSKSLFEFLLGDQNQKRYKKEFHNAVKKAFNDESDNEVLRIKNFIQRRFKKDFKNIIQQIENQLLPISLWVYGITSNLDADQLESGRLHAYRGVLSPSASGLKKLFQDSIDLQKDTNLIDSKHLDKVVLQVNENIKKAG